MIILQLGLFKTIFYSGFIIVLQFRFSLDHRFIRLFDVENISLFEIETVLIFRSRYDLYSDRRTISFFQWNIWSWNTSKETFTISLHLFWLRLSTFFNVVRMQISLDENDKLVEHEWKRNSFG